MTKISVYQIDEYVTADDKWIGTDVNTYNKTKNFTPRKLATYFNGSQVINTGVDLLYKYFTITPPEDRPAGTLSFETEIGATVDFSDINTFLLSKTTLKGNDVSEFLDFLVNSTSLIYKAKNINLFGSYKIVSVDTYFLDPNFFVVTVDFLEGNGFIEEDEDYMISVVDLDKTIPIPQLVKETFDYESSNTFTVANEINNVLQVIVNTTSLHPDAYSYTLPSTVTVINELFAGDVITVVYNYLEEFLEVPDLQRVTSVGNHTTNNIILDNLPGENGDYTTINTLNDLGTFQSYTSPIDTDYQSVYAGYEMSINEIYSPTESLEMYIGQGIIQTSYTNDGDYNAARLYSGNSVNGPSLYIEKNDINGQIKIDDLTDNITLQFPDKPLGIYTIATTEDVPPFTPSDYDLDEFTNLNADPFAKISDIPVLGYTPVNKAGDTMLGDLILNRDPEVALGAATKQYVDNIVSGINFHPPVVVATDVSLVATYDNGIDGVGATLTGPSVGVLMIDGETPTYLQRILVWQQADPIENGIYDLTTVGDSVTVYQLTRSSDADNSPPGEIHYGDYTLVLSGDTNGGFGFICNTPGTIDIGTTPITYIQFNAAQAVTAGYGLQEAVSNVISIDPLVTQEKITLTTTGSGAATLVSNTLNIPTLPQATTSVSGYLSSTDWNTFTNKENSANKQNSLAVDGTGTKFPTVDAVNTLATSLFEQVNTVTTPTYTIQASDASNLISFNYPSNSFMTVTMPNNSVIPFPIGTRIKINRIAGNWGISISGTGVDFLRGNQVVQTTGSMDGGGGTSTLTKISTNRWRIDDAPAFVFNYPNWSVSNGTVNAGNFQGGNFNGTQVGISNQANISFSDTITLNKVSGYSAGSGTQIGLSTSFSFAPISGTGVFNTFNVNPTINQTGGANGITRGLYINPTLTAAADFRAIEVVTGKVIVPTAVNSNEAINKGQVDNRLVLEKSGNYTLTNADSGGIIIFTASATLTIPNSLADGFECTFVTLASATLTVDRGSNILYNNTGTVLLPQLSFTLKRRILTDQYITAGSL